MLGLASSFSLLRKRSRFFINLLIAGLTQGKWPFDFVILDGIMR